MLRRPQDPRARLARAVGGGFFLRRPHPSQTPGRLHAGRRRVLLAAILAFSTLPTLGTQHVHAHASGSHWHRGGSAVSVYFWDQTGGCGTSGTPTNDALYDIYYNPHPLYIYCVNDHTDVSVYEANEPGADFCGLAERWSSGGHTSHGHARINTYSACVNRRNNVPGGLSVKLYKQGIHCQEIWHTVGYGHSDTQDCMGGTTGSYFSGSIGKYGIGSTGAYKYDWDHQTIDAYNLYRYH